MVGSKLKAFLGQWAALAVVVLALGLGTAVQPAAAQHKANENDMEVPTNNMEIVQQGRAKYAQRCSFCHGGDGHGGKGPCLSCGAFKYTGNTNSEIYVTIAVGVPRSLVSGDHSAWVERLDFVERSDPLMAGLRVRLGEIG